MEERQKILFKICEYDYEEFQASNPIRQGMILELSLSNKYVYPNGSIIEDWFDSR